MILALLRWIGYLTLVYFILMQSYMIWLGLRSAVLVRRARHLQRFGRVTDMLSSQTSPPVSIVIPAYNEATGIADSVRSMSIVGYPEIRDRGHQRRIHRRDTADADRRLPARESPHPLPARHPDGRGERDLSRSGQCRDHRDRQGERGPRRRTERRDQRRPISLCPVHRCRRDPRRQLPGQRDAARGRRPATHRCRGREHPAAQRKPGPARAISSAPGCRSGSVPRMQVLEYLRTFLASRPAWSKMEALPLVSGAFGIWKRSAVIAVGGFSSGHMGEDMDLTMRLHRHHMDNRIPYRIVYEPSAVIWTEVPDTMRVLKRQRVRWHRGLMTAVKDFMPMTFNPRYGKVGMITWAAMFLFEFVAPIVEFAGWITIPLALLLGALNTTSLVILLDARLRGRAAQLPRRPLARRGVRLLHLTGGHRPAHRDGADRELRDAAGDGGLEDPCLPRGTIDPVLGQHGAQGRGQPRRRDLSRAEEREAGQDSPLSCAARSSAAIASTNSSRSPASTWSNRFSVSPMRWSVTRLSL